MSLADDITRMHGAKARWVDTVPVRETDSSDIVWEGEVHVFALDGHPEADTCYAWEHETDEGTRRIVTVLGVEPINSAADAVRAAIVQEHRNKGTS